MTNTLDYTRTDNALRLLLKFVRAVYPNTIAHCVLDMPEHHTYIEYDALTLYANIKTIRGVAAMLSRSKHFDFTGYTSLTFNVELDFEVTIKHADVPQNRFYICGVYGFMISDYWFEPIMLTRYDNWKLLKRMRP